MGSGADKFSICLNAEIGVPMALKDIIEIDKILICEGCFPKVTDKISKFFTKLTLTYMKNTKRSK